MRRFAPLCLAAALAAVPAASAAAQQRPPLLARVSACTTGAAPAQRSAAFTASMPAIGRTARMWVRFDLLQRMPGESAFAPVRLPGWGRWQRSEPNRSAFIYTKRVRALRPAASYRARVLFRWSAADGRILRRAVRFTGVCRQPDLRPDLRVDRLDGAPGLTPGTATYLLAVSNDGRTAAGPFTIALTVPGAAPVMVAVDGLARGATGTVSIAAPSCAPGSTVHVAVDSEGAVDESDESGGTLDLACPVAS